MRRALRSSRMTASCASSSATPFSPPSGPPQRLFQGPPAKSKFLAAQIPSSSGFRCRSNVQFKGGNGMVQSLVARQRALSDTGRTPHWPVCGSQGAGIRLHRRCKICMDTRQIAQKRAGATFSFRNFHSVIAACQPPFPRPPVRPNGCFRGLPPTPFSPPCGPATGSFNGLHAKANFYQP